MRETGGCLISLIRTEGLVTVQLARRFRKHGLSPAAFSALSLLDRADAPLCPHEIGERLMVTRGAVTGLLDSLERQALVKRRPDPQDRRRLRVQLTPAGAALLQTVSAEHSAGERQLLAGLNAAERETLHRLLAKLQGHLQTLS